MVEVLQGRGKENLETSHTRPDAKLRSQLERLLGSAMSACRQGVKMHKSMLCAMLYMRLLQAFASADPWFEASLVEQLINYPDEVLEQARFPHPGACLLAFASESMPATDHLTSAEPCATRNHTYARLKGSISSLRRGLMHSEQKWLQLAGQNRTHTQNTFLMCDAVKLAGQLESAGLLSSMQEQQLRANGILQIRCEGPTEKVGLIFLLPGRQHICDDCTVTFCSHCLCVHEVLGLRLFAAQENHKPEFSIKS